MRPASYQSITAGEIPTIAIPGGTARVIASELEGTKDPAHTFSSINLWDIRLAADEDMRLALPEGHNAMIAVLSGHITIAGEGVGPAEIARLPAEGEEAALHTDGKAMLGHDRRTDRRAGGWLWPLRYEQ